MPHQDVPKHVYVIARQPGAVESMPDDSTLVRYEPFTLTTFCTLNEWVLRTCWVYIQHFPRDLQDAFRDAGRVAGTHGDRGTHGTDLLRSWGPTPLPPLEQALRMALLLQAAYDHTPGGAPSASGSDDLHEPTTSSEQGELPSPSLTSLVSPTSPGW